MTLTGDGKLHLSSDDVAKLRKLLKSGMKLNAERVRLYLLQALDQIDDQRLTIDELQQAIAMETDPDYTWSGGTDAD